jgi:hypothetical protein
VLLRLLLSHRIVPPPPQEMYFLYATTVHALFCDEHKYCTSNAIVLVVFTTARHVIGLTCVSVRGRIILNPSLVDPKIIHWGSSKGYESSSKIMTISEP